ncbi:glucosamine-6-phosphate deaminase [Cellulomonas citrea]|uniref:glucosamine-6-phosphate deaminase n=1 Tax=Cellulomonas citrea TaxID=1909423 RepID=UPI001F2A186E|nr:glucosamine-6-phosphate deaminase [Cellulomonas citrea]
MSTLALRRRLTLDVVTDPAAAGRAVAGRIGELVAARPDAVIGVATGSSAEPVYTALAALVRRDGLDLRAVRWFALDEYLGLPAGHREGYRQVLTRQLVEPLGLDPAALHVPDPSGDPAVAALAYERAIEEAGGVDLQLLGIGANGHLAFNEPGTPFEQRTHVTELTASTRAANDRFFVGGERTPTHALTQGLGTIAAARELELVAFGVAKAEALYRAIEGPVDPSCPASLIQRHPCAKVTADDAAVALLVV